MRFQNGCNKVVIELRVLQFWSEIILVISNRTRAARSFNFEITRMISDQIALHSVQLPLFTTTVIWKSIRCSEEFMPKQQIFTVREHINLLSSTSSAILKSHLKWREILLWLPKLVKQVTDFAQCQQELFVTKTRWPLKEVNYNKICHLGNTQTVIESP